MNNFQLLEYAAWGLSGIIGVWLLFDLLKTDRSYSEEFLTSSREGEIDDVFVDEHRH
jgi:hypothetical protein